MYLRTKNASELRHSCTYKTRKFPTVLLFLPPTWGEVRLKLEYLSKKPWVLTWVCVVAAELWKFSESFIQGLAVSFSLGCLHTLTGKILYCFNKCACSPLFSAASKKPNMCHYVKILGQENRMVSWAEYINTCYELWIFFYV